MTEDSKASFDIEEALAQVPELLPDNKLDKIQELLGQKTPTSLQLMTELGETPVMLLSIAMSFDIAPERFKGAPAPVLQGLSAFNERLRQHAPRLFEHPILKEIAEKLAKGTSTEDGGFRPEPLFDDINGVQSIPVFVGTGQELNPLLRTEIYGPKGLVGRKLMLRLPDAAFLASVFLGSLGNALEHMRRLAKAELLGETDLEALKGHLNDVEKNFERVKAALGSAELKGTAGK